MSRNSDHPRDFRVVNQVRDEEQFLAQQGERENNFQEETSLEYAPNRPMQTYEADYDAVDGGEVEGRGIGIVAIILSIASLFFWHVFLGVVAVVLGFIAAGRGSRGLGYTSVVIGAFSIFVSLFATPFVT